MDVFGIKDLENLSGIKAHTIRMWEQRYSFLKPARTATNIRYYSNHELKIILNTALLNKYGFKISHIDRMSEKEISQKINSLTHAEAQTEKTINKLIHHMIDLDMDKFEKILDDHISEKGINKTILHLIFPYLERIGILWSTNYIHPVQEHLVTNIIRQKLIAGIESTSATASCNKKIVLFLPEGESHELGLLYIYYLLKNRGAKIFYLGANVPIKDVHFLSVSKKPDYLYTHLTSVTGGFDLNKFIKQINQLMPSIPLVISGRLAQRHAQRLPARVQLKKSLPEVTEYVTCL
jgi:DNA-binding transcriptional MerR regulator